MVRRQFCTTGVGLVIIALVYSPCPAAPQASRQNREKQDAARIHAAEKDVKRVREKFQDDIARLRESRRELSDAEREHDQRSVATQHVRDELKAKHESALHLDKALRALEEAQANYDRLAQPLVEKLHQQTEFQTAQAAAESARTQLRALSTSKVPSSDRASETADLQRQILAPVQLEQQTLQAHPELEPPRAALQDARAQVAAIKKRVEQGVESDPALKDSVRALQQARDRVAKAKAQVASREQAVGSAQQKLAKEQADVQRAKAKDRANDRKRP